MIAAFCLAKIKWSGFAKPHLKNGVLVVDDYSVNNNNCDEESETKENQKNEKEIQVFQDLAHELR